jgi:hypothetical protein
MKRAIYVLGLLLCAFAANSAYAQSSINTTGFGSGGTVAVTPAHIGDFILLKVYTSGGGGSPYITSISDTQGNTWNHSVVGTFGASSSYHTVGSGDYFVSAFYTYATATSADTITPVWNGGAPGTKYLWAADCVDIASSSPILTNIYNDQASPGTGTNAVTTSGGTGSATVSSVPALIVGLITAVNATPTVSAGTGFSQSSGTGGGGFDDGYLVEYQRVTFTGTYNATATLSSASEAESWMIALAEVAGSTKQSGQFFLSSGLAPVPTGVEGRRMSSR